MKRRSILNVSATIALGLSFFCITGRSTASAGEIKLLCAVALHPAIDALIPDFEKSSGHKVTVAYGNAGAIADRFRKGEAADLVINAAPLMDQLRAQGKVVAGDRIIIAKVGVSAFVRKVPQSPTSVRPTPSNARCWPQDRLLILIRPVGVPVASTWPACSNDWASLGK
jgi:molybdate transport system substrate-binding protein